MIAYSIVISCYNQKETIRLALESLRRQIKSPKIFEVVIADDASVDGTDMLIRKLRYPIYLKYTRAEKNEGRALNRNRGIAKAAGGKIILIDGDMVPSPGFIEAYLDGWNEFPGAVCIGSRKPPSDQQLPRWEQYIYSRGRQSRERGYAVPGKYFTSDNFSIDKTIIDDLGGFDENFQIWGGEDTDFGLRLERGGVPIRYIPEALCYHHHIRTFDGTLEGFVKFGQTGYPLLLQKYPQNNIFEKGWLLGLPDPKAGVIKKLAGLALSPLRSSPVLAILKFSANYRGAALFSDAMLDWLFYGCLARGYRQSQK